MILEKYAYEIKAWHRTLDYLLQENVEMKNRVAEIDKLQGNRAVLQKMEYYNNLFLNKDTTLAFLRRDIKNLESVNEDSDALRYMHKKLRQDMEKTEREFCTLKYSFEDFMISMIN